MTETVGISKRITGHGLKEHEVSGLVKLIYRKHVVLRAAYFESRHERQMIMLKWKIEYDLFQDSLRKHHFEFLIELYDTTVHIDHLPGEL